MIQKLRIASLIGIQFLILAHIYIFGDEIIGSLDFQEFFHAFVKYGIINAGAILVILAFVITLIFGRFFCGWACHFGAVQELSWWLLKKMGITPTTLNSSLVTIFPLFILLNFYLAPNLAHALSSPWEGVSISLGMPEIWAFLPGFVIGTLTFLVDGFLIVYFLGRKGFCRFLCPWGAFLKLPNSLAMFKVRNIGGCQNCGNCTSECPIGIDVSYEINNYGKVTNTNCTSCLVCTEGCPSSAISYKWVSPMNENFQLKHYGINRDMFKLSKIADKFQSLHSRDFLFLPLILIFGFAIDGLYGMGHFLSFGIAVIASVQVITLKEKIQHSKVRNLMIGMIFIVIIWHGVIKFSIWQGLEQFEKNKYSSAISHLERAVKMYPKSIGRFHLILGQMYMETGEVEKAMAHAIRAQNINPKHDAPVELLKKINALE
ncbi:MAG: 4Fe-4S binding protein [Candidatus Marinimicrobia bacterium]|jgi:polyferredoxin|nr:4Fe-4S binding protein [Candidatus Neomarinimicrobiota bacterium]